MFSCHLATKLKVPVKVGLLAKPPLTQTAFEWLFLVVNVSDVALEVRRDAELATAKLTSA